MKFIGEQLRSLRLERNIGLRKTAGKMGKVSSYVVKVEQGLLHPRADILSAYFEAIGVPKNDVNREKIEAISGLLEDIRNPSCAGEDHMKLRQRQIKRIEEVSTEIMSYSSSYVPGDMQDEGYFQAMLRHIGVSKGKNQELIDLRIARRKTLAKHGLRRSFIMSASAITLRLGTPKVMSAQLFELASIVEGTRHFIGMTPPGSPFSMTSSFGILDSKMVWADLLDELEIVTDPTRVSRYIEYFRSMRESQGLIVGSRFVKILRKRAEALSLLADWPETLDKSLTTLS